MKYETIVINHKNHDTAGTVEVNFHGFEDGKRFDKSNSGIPIPGHVDATLEVYGDWSGYIADVGQGFGKCLVTSVTQTRRDFFLVRVRSRHKHGGLFLFNMTNTSKWIDVCVSDGTVDILHALPAHPGKATLDTSEIVPKLLPDFNALGCGFPDGAGSVVVYQMLFA
ncbi:hypothetical protein [Luteibacter sp.]|uniref:hypothetical protein n=1 Tax=Luteibacter sp. TaxID=1886636 RepID=UPI003F7E0F5A